jgi:hypothetical protein
MLVHPVSYGMHIAHFRPYILYLTDIMIALMPFSFNIWIQDMKAFIYMVEVPIRKPPPKRTLI